MNEDLKRELTNIFDTFSFKLTETKEIDPLFMVVLPSKEILPIHVNIPGEDGVSLLDYAKASILAAEEYDAEGLIFISEQFVVIKPKDDENYHETQLLMRGLIKPSEHPDREEYLALSYISAEGEISCVMGKIHKDFKGTRYIKDSYWTDKNMSNFLVPWKELKKGN